MQLITKSLANLSLVTEYPMAKTCIIGHIGNTFLSFKQAEYLHQRNLVSGVVFEIMYSPMSKAIGWDIEDFLIYNN